MTANVPRVWCRGVQIAPNCRTSKNLIEWKKL